MWQIKDCITVGMGLCSHLSFADYKGMQIIREKLFFMLILVQPIPHVKLI